MKSTICWNYLVKPTRRSSGYYWHGCLIPELIWDSWHIKWNICQDIKVLSISVEALIGCFNALFRLSGIMMKALSLWQWMCWQLHHHMSPAFCSYGWVKLLVSSSCVCLKHRQVAMDSWQHCRTDVLNLKPTDSFGVHGWGGGAEPGTIFFFSDFSPFTLKVVFVNNILNDVRARWVALFVCWGRKKREFFCSTSKISKICGRYEL